MTFRLSRSQSNQQGASLIEVMVALFVLAVGLLGVLALQANAMKFNQSAYAYSQAAFLANDILESIRTNPSAAASYAINLDDPTPTGAPDCANVQCNSQQLKQWNVQNWRTNVETRLVSGKSAIQLDGTILTVTVQFDDSRASASANNAPVLHEYILVTEI